MIFIANFLFTIKQITITLTFFNTIPPSYINRKVIIFSSYIFLNLQEFKGVHIENLFYKGVIYRIYTCVCGFFITLTNVDLPSFNHFGHHQNQNQNTMQECNPFVISIMIFN